MIYVIILLSLILVILLFPEIYNGIKKVIDYLKEKKNGKENSSENDKRNKNQ